MTLDVKKVRLLMAEKEINCAELARAAKMHAQTLNMWLNHGTKPRLDKIGKLAKALGVEVTEIIAE